MKTLKAISLIVLAALCVTYLMARPFTPFWLDSAVIIFAIGILLFKWLAKTEKGKDENSDEPPK